MIAQLSRNIPKTVLKSFFRTESAVHTNGITILLEAYKLNAEICNAEVLRRRLKLPTWRYVTNRLAAMERRLVKYHPVPKAEWSSGETKYWDLLFEIGYVQPGDLKTWRLLPNVVNALAELGLLAESRPASPQATYLFAWNPNQWDWKDLGRRIDEVRLTDATTMEWTCASHKTIHHGDRAFLVRLGKTPKGIMASGYVVSEPFPSTRATDRSPAHSVFIEFDTILKPTTDSLISLDQLKSPLLRKQQWLPQSSGISIRSECVAELEALWFQLTGSRIPRGHSENSEQLRRDNIIEGTALQVLQTRYERNPYARKLCLDHYGYACQVCTFDFAENYGSLGAGFIHVHHEVSIAKRGGRYRVDPVRDLKPVCPNCHAMLHRKDPPMKIDELKTKLKESH